MTWDCDLTLLHLWLVEKKKQVQQTVMEVTMPASILISVVLGSLPSRTKRMRLTGVQVSDSKAGRKSGKLPGSYPGWLTFCLSVFVVLWKNHGLNIFTIVSFGSICVQRSNEQWGLFIIKTWFSRASKLRQDLGFLVFPPTHQAHMSWNPLLGMMFLHISCLLKVFGQIPSAAKPKPLTTWDSNPIQPVPLF